MEGASQKTSNKHSHANTRQAHTTSIAGSLRAAPQLLPGLSGIPLQCTSLSSLSLIFSPRGKQRGRGRCCGWVTVQVGDGQAAGCSFSCRALAPARAAAAAAAAPDDAEEEEESPSEEEEEEDAGGDAVAMVTQLSGG